MCEIFRYRNIFQTSLILETERLNKKVFCVVLKKWKLKTEFIWFTLSKQFFFPVLLKYNKYQNQK